MNRNLIAAATIVLVGGLAVVVFGSVRHRDDHPHPAPSSSHGAGIDHAMSAVVALYHAPVGATNCETAYNAFKASLDLSNTGQATPIVMWLPPHDDFIARCNALPPATQQCLIPIYLAEHRTECQPAKPPDDVLAKIVQIKHAAEPGSQQDNGGVSEPPPMGSL